METAMAKFTLHNPARVVEPEIDPAALEAFAAGAHVGAEVQVAQLDGPLGLVAELLFQGRGQRAPERGALVE